MKPRLKLLDGALWLRLPAPPFNASHITFIKLLLQTDDEALAAHKDFLKSCRELNKKRSEEAYALSFGWRKTLNTQHTRPETSDIGDCLRRCFEKIQREWDVALPRKKEQRWFVGMFFLREQFQEAFQRGSSDANAAYPLKARAKTPKLRAPYTKRQQALPLATTAP